MKTILRQANPRLADEVYKRAGTALRRVGPPKVRCRATGVTDRMEQAWDAGDHRSPVGRCAEQLLAYEEAGLNAYEVLVHFDAELRAARMKLSVEELRNLLHEQALEETRHQCSLDPLQMEAQDDPDVCLTQLEARAHAHMAALANYLATIRVLKAKRGTTGGQQ